jgi:YbgC/YbaW family acyl-CoA thioester hydrolase
MRSGKDMIVNRIEKKISWGDLDSLCIVFYPKYYEWMDGCTHLYFEKIGLDLVRLWHERKLIFSLVSTSCDYFRPGRYHQEIVVETVMEKLEKKTVTMGHTIMDKHSGKIMVKGLEKRICMNVHNLDQFSAMDIPDDLARIFNTSL